MPKLILFVKRKPGLTHEQFRAHYESTHAPLARRVLPWLDRYTRNFLTPFPGQPEPPYDCVTEFWFKDEAALRASIEWTRFRVRDAGCASKATRRPMSGLRSSGSSRRRSIPNFIRATRVQNHPCGGNQAYPGRV